MEISCKHLTGLVHYGDFDADVLLFRFLAVLRTESRYNSTLE
jgi:hypothetical protein